MGRDTPRRAVLLDVAVMSTPAERKALLFFGIVAMLGAGVRVWRSSRPAPMPHPEQSDATAGIHAPGSGRPSSPHSARISDSRRTSVQKRTSVSKTARSNRDSTAVVDLDRATVSELDALGVLPSGMARLIVADRDSFGPFGSIDELRRVPFLSAGTLRKLAPRVTFSRIPRPRNTVVHPHPLTAAAPARRAARVQR
jgi:DNA uptake protein ComE-like DNA-binding protein